MSSFIFASISTAVCKMSTKIISQKVLLALDQVREEHPKETLKEARQIIDKANEALWKKLRGDKDHYLMDKDEFSLFNYFVISYTSGGGEDATIATAAISRYWNSTRNAA